MNRLVGGTSPWNVQCQGMVISHGMAHGVGPMVWVSGASPPALTSRYFWDSDLMAKEKAGSDPGYLGDGFHGSPDLCKMLVFRPPLKPLDLWDHGKSIFIPFVFLQKT